MSFPQGFPIQSTGSDLNNSDASSTLLSASCLATAVLHVFIYMPTVISYDDKRTPSAPLSTTTRVISELALDVCLPSVPRSIEDEFPGKL